MVLRVYLLLLLLRVVAVAVAVVVVVVGVGVSVVAAVLLLLLLLLRLHMVWLLQGWLQVAPTATAVVKSARAVVVPAIIPMLQLPPPLRKKQGKEDAGGRP
jgi:hypothetical protein